MAKIAMRATAKADVALSATDTRAPIGRALQDHGMPEQRSAARRRNIERMLKPRHVAFIGGGWAAAALRNCADFGFEGEMWYVNPRRPEVDGHPVFGSVRDLPQAPDCAYVAVSAERSIEVLAELADRGAGGAVCYAAGFAEKGAEGAALQARLVAAAGDMAVLGPNCYGMLDYRLGLHVWAGDRMEPRPGPGIAIVSQSGALAEVLIFEQRDVPIVSVVSVGNQAVLGIEDIVDVLLDDPGINAIGIYLEGVRDAPLLSEVAARALDRSVPIVALKSGCSEIAATLTLGHTSSLAGEDALYQAYFDRLGIIRVDSLGRMLESLKLLSRAGPLATPRFAAMTISGGGAAMIADYAEYYGAVPAPLDDVQVQRLQTAFPDYVNCGNPLDITVGGMEPQMVAVAADVLAGGQAEFVMTMLDSLSGGSYEGINAMIMDTMAAALERHGKRGGALGCLPESLAPHTRERALRLGLVPMHGLEEAVAAVADAARYGAARRVGAETPAGSEIAGSAAGAAGATPYPGRGGEQGLPRGGRHRASRVAGGPREQGDECRARSRLPGGAQVRRRRHRAQERGGRGGARPRRRSGDRRRPRDDASAASGEREALPRRASGGGRRR